MPSTVPASLPEDYSYISYLDLSSNPAHVDVINSTGRLPEWIQKCTNLQFLIADGLSLTVIDDWVSESLLHLRVIRLSNNNITIWPDHLSRLLPYDHISVIDLEGNPCFMNFCERCPRFATDYAKAAGYLSARKGLLRNGTRKKSSTGSVGSGGHRDSVVSISSNTFTPAPAKKKSSFFFGKSKRKKDQTLYEGSVSSSPVPQSTYNGAHYSDDSSDDEMLTSLEPVFPQLMKKVAIDRSRSVASMNSQDNMIPDKWVQKRIELTEIEKTKVLLNHLRDIWELASHSIIAVDPTLSAAASMQRSLSISSSSTARQSLSALSPRTSYSSMTAANNNPTHRDASRVSSAKLKNTIHSHSRLNSLDVLEQYLDEESIDVEMPKISPPDRTQIIAMLTRTIEDEKNYVLRLGELMTIYVSSKKRPPKTNHLFGAFPSFNRLHSSIMLGALQRCLDGYVSRTDPNLNRFAELFEAHMKEFQVYIEYEIAVEESMRLIHFWKRITAIETNQPGFHGSAALPNLGSYRNADGQMAEWIQSCLHHKAHKLNGIADYLQLPIDQLERYRILLRKLSTITPELEAVYRQFDGICTEIDLEKPKIAQQRRMAEFDQMYNMGALMAPRNSNMPARRYLGDAVVLLNSEVRLELPSAVKGVRSPDAFHYMNTSAPDVSNNSLYGSSSVAGAAANPVSTRSNPVPKVVMRTVVKTKFHLPLFRIIVCDDVVVVTSEDKKKVLKVIDRRQMSTTLPWKYPVRDSTDGLPTGELASLKSRSSTGSNGAPLTTINTGSNNNNNSSSSSSSHVNTTSSSVRLVFHDEPVVWYCSLRAFTGGKKSNYKEPRSRMVELFQG